MAKKTKAEKQDQPQEEPKGIVFNFGPAGGGAIGQGHSLL